MDFRVDGVLCRGRGFIPRGTVVEFRLFTFDTHVLGLVYGLEVLRGGLGIGGLERFLFLFWVDLDFGTCTIGFHSKRNRKISFLKSK